MANLIKLCANAKYTVTIPEQQTCCGLPYFEKGELIAAKAIGEYNLSVFAQTTLICGSPKCCNTYVVKYPKIFNNTVSHNESVNLSKHTIGLDALFEKLTLSSTKAVKEKYFFFNCQPSGKDTEFYTSKFPHAQWSFPSLHATCCGAETCMPVHSRENASKMAMTLISEAVESGADYMVTTDDICRKHIMNIAAENQINIRTLHLIDLFASAL